MWNYTVESANWGKVWKLQIDEIRASVARQRENRCACVGADALLAELLAKALHGALGRVVVFAEVAKHDVLDGGMIHFGDKTR